MPIKKSKEPLTKVTLNLFTKDVERLKQLHSEKHTTYLRQLLRAHLARVDASIASGGTDLAKEINLHG